MLHRSVFAVLAALAIAFGAAPAAWAGRDVLAVDLVDEPSSLDPLIQWNPDSYFVHRNTFDNLVTRDGDGRNIAKGP